MQHDQIGPSSLQLRDTSKHPKIGLARRKLAECHRSRDPTSHAMQTNLQFLDSGFRVAMFRTAPINFRAENHQENPKMQEHAIAQMRSDVLSSFDIDLEGKALFFDRPSISPIQVGQDRTNPQDDAARFSH